MNIWTKERQIAQHIAKVSNTTFEKSNRRTSRSYICFELYADNEVEIASFHVSESCIGLGSKAMQSLIYQADEHGINLMLIPAGDGSRRKRLVELYERFGFQEDGELMRRTAKPVMHQLAEPEKAYKDSLA